MTPSRKIVINTEAWIQDINGWPIMAVNDKDRRERLSDIIINKVLKYKLLNLIMNKQTYNSAKENENEYIKENRIGIVKSNIDSWYVKGTLKQLRDQKLVTRIRVTIEAI